MADRTYTIKDESKNDGSSCSCFVINKAEEILNTMGRIKPAFTAEQKELFKEIRNDFKARPWQERLYIVGEGGGTYNIVDVFIGKYPEKEKEALALLDLDAQTDWVDSICHNEMIIAWANFFETDKKMVKKSCKAIGITFADYKKWLKKEVN